MGRTRNHDKWCNTSLSSFLFLVLSSKYGSCNYTDLGNRATYYTDLGKQNERLFFFFSFKFEGSLEIRLRRRSVISEPPRIQQRERAVCFWWCCRFPEGNSRPSAGFHTYRKAVSAASSLDRCLLIFPGTHPGVEKLDSTHALEDPHLRLGYRTSFRTNKMKK
jgi:hypothetical protein